MSNAQAVVLLVLVLVVGFIVVRYMDRQAAARRPTIGGGIGQIGAGIGSIVDSAMSTYGGGSVVQ